MPSLPFPSFQRGTKAKERGGGERGRQETETEHILTNQAARPPPNLRKQRRAHLSWWERFEAVPERVPKMLFAQPIQQLNKQPKTPLGNLQLWCNHCTSMQRHLVVVDHGDGQRVIHQIPSRRQLLLAEPKPPPKSGRVAFVAACVLCCVVCVCVCVSVCLCICPCVLCVCVVCASACSSHPHLPQETPSCAHSRMHLCLLASPPDSLVPNLCVEIGQRRRVRISQHLKFRTAESTKERQTHPRAGTQTHIRVEQGRNTYARTHARTHARAHSDNSSRPYSR